MSGRRLLVERDERLDRIARAVYGSEAGGTVEALLDANPGLAELGIMVPAGTVILVPETVQAETSAAIRPWI